MYRLLFFAIFLLLAGPAQAQRYNRTLRGEVRIPGRGRQYYYIYYNADGPRLTGSSVTQGENKDLKAALIGRLSDDGTEMYLRETESLDPLEPGMTLCFFAARLKLTVYPDRRVWTGSFSSRQPNGLPCDGGTMTFVDLNPKAPPPPKPKIKTPVPAAESTAKPAAAQADTARRRRRTRVRTVVRDTVAKPPTAALPRPPDPMPDTTGLGPFYHWRDATLTFEVWDGVKEDGDVVTVLYNGNPVLSDVRLTLAKQVFTVPVSYNKVDTLTVLMLHEGNLPANTVRLNLVGSDQRHELELSGSYGDRKRFYFLRREW